MIKNLFVQQSLDLLHNFYNLTQLFLKSVDASNVASRNIEYYFNLLEKIVEEVGEEYVVQVVTDNEATLKAAGLKLMKKRHHLYWFPCAPRCLDLCIEDIGKKIKCPKSA